MEIRQLEIFRALADELHFTRAAARVHCVQSNVTTQIRSLEAELGVPLFERLGKQVILTEHGRRLVPYAERVLQLLLEAPAAVASGEQPAGTLAVGTPESVLSYHLPRVLQIFHERYPLVELAFRPFCSSQLWHPLENGTIDIVFLIDDFVANPVLHVEVLRPEPMCLLVNAGHPLMAKGRVSPTDLKDQTLLLTESGCGYRRKLERALAQAGVTPNSVVEFASVEAIKQCAVLGMGIAHLPAITVAAEIAQQKLAALPWSGPDLTISTQIAWHRDKWLSPAMQAFVRLVREEIAPHATMA
jgi:DNA-binding transcriptional LysR family regulator